MDKRNVVISNQFKEQVAFLRLARLSVAENETDFASNVVAVDLVLHSLQKLSGSLISTSGKPTNVQQEPALPSSLSVILTAAKSLPIYVSLSWPTCWRNEVNS